MKLGWMVVAAIGDGKIKGMPSSPQALDMIPTYFHAMMPTMGGVWNDREEANGVLKAIPKQFRANFKVVPVAVTILEEGV